MLKHLQLDPAIGLDKQLLFWLSIGVPVSLGLFLAIPVWIGYSPDFSESGYETFLRISKFPIAICSLAVPLSVLIGKLHGARQAALQIENTRKQIENAEAQIQNTLTQIANTEQDNRTKLYLAHFDHFCKHIDFVESALTKRYHHQFVTDSEPEPLINKINLYKFMYRQNSLRAGVYPLDTHFKTFSANLMSRLLESYEHFLYSQNRDDLHRTLKFLENVLIHIQVKLFHCRKSRSSIFLRPDMMEARDYTDFPLSINANIDDYLDQVLFWARLLEGVDSFENSDNSESSAYGILTTLGMPHSPKPSDMGKIAGYWQELTLRVFSGITFNVEPD
jgi:hypothetical protein